MTMTSKNYSVVRKQQVYLKYSSTLAIYNKTVDGRRFRVFLEQFKYSEYPLFKFKMMLNLKQLMPDKTLEVVEYSLSLKKYKTLYQVNNK